MRIKLDKKWQAKLLDLPESGMGFQNVKVKLKDGTKINGTVFNSEILQVSDKQDNFGTKDIEDIGLGLDSDS